MENLLATSGDFINRDAVHRSVFKLNSLVRLASVVLLAGCIFILNFAAADPGLHRLLHIGQETALAHQCAVTLFAQGQVDTVAAEIHPVISDSFIGLIPPTTVSVYQPAIEDLPAGRAPPVSSSNS